MTESDLNRIFDNYRDSLGTCSRTWSTKTHRRTFPKLVLPAAASLCAALFLFAIWPRSAASSLFQQVGQAISNARSMVVHFERFSSSTGKWVEWHRLYYRDSMWRLDYMRSSIYDRSILIRDGKMLSDYAELNYATIEPEDPDFRIFDDLQVIDALSFAKKSVTVGYESGIEWEPCLPVNGKDAYVLNLTVWRTGTKARITVDSSSHLPIAVEYRSGNRQFRQMYEFNTPVDEGLFELSSPKPILDLEAEQAELAEKWKVPVGRLGIWNIRDACITENGIIWIVMSTKKEESKIGRWTLKVGSQNSQFGRGQPMVSSSPMARTNRATVEGEVLQVVPFVPMDQKSGISPSAQLQFRQEGYLDENKYVFQTEPAINLNLNLRVERSSVPAYIPSLNLGQMSLNMPLFVWGIRAKTHENEDRLREAALAYEKCASILNQKSPFGGYTYQFEAERCYRLAGDTEKSVQVLRQAEEMKRSFERR